MTTFINELEQLHATFERDPVSMVQKGIEHATSLALDQLIRSPISQDKFTQGARAVAFQGKKLYRVETWTGRGPRFGEYSIADLLLKGNFISKAQDFLDETYGKGFRIFNHKLVQENSFSLSISWDQEKKRRPPGTSAYRGPIGGAASEQSSVSRLTEPNSILIPKEKIKTRRKENSVVPDYNL
jgi:hypothetical protein